MEYLAESKGMTLEEFRESLTQENKVLRWRRI
jgi:hypothetical protein